jgi:hypothetical protein
MALFDQVPEDWRVAIGLTRSDAARAKLDTLLAD